MYKKSLFLLFLALSCMFSLFSQNSKHYDLTHGNFVRNQRDNIDISDKNIKLDRIYSNTYEIVFDYNATGYCTFEMRTDQYDASSNYKAIYTYDDNNNLTRVDIYSWVNNDWFHSCYEIFVYNENNQRIERSNYNIFGSTPSMGGLGTYSYDEDGNLTEYLQLLHVGNNNFENLSKDVYTYENGLISNITYYYWQNEEWTYSNKADFTYQDGKPLQITNSSYDNGWTIDEQHVWSYGTNGILSQRDLYYANNNILSTNSSDRHIFVFDESVNAENVLYPYVNSVFDDWERWFDLEKKMVSDEWWTEDVNSGILSYIEISNYEYSDVNVKIDDNTTNSTLIYPNPIRDIIIINTLENNDLNIVIYNSLGQVIHQEESQGNTIIDAANFPQGLYYINVYSNYQLITTKKLIKQ